MTGFLANENNYISQNFWIPPHQYTDSVESGITNIYPDAEEYYQMVAVGSDAGFHESFESIAPVSGSQRVGLIVDQLEGQPQITVAVYTWVGDPRTYTLVFEQVFTSVGNKGTFDITLPGGSHNVFVVAHSQTGVTDPGSASLFGDVSIVLLPPAGAQFFWTDFEGSREVLL